MSVRAWRQRWMWLALSACGGTSTPAWMTPAPGTTKVSVFDAAPLAKATYVATVESGGRPDPGARIELERGSFKCGALVHTLNNARPDLDPAVVAATSTCELGLGKLLRQDSGFLFVVDGRGARWMTAAEVLAAAGPIDTRAKALLAVWVAGTHELSWTDGDHVYGGLEDGIVREVAGGFEVVAGITEEKEDCGDTMRSTVTRYRITLRVDARGSLTERGRVVSHRAVDPSACQPMGRRPAGFVDVSAGDTVRGHLRRAMHHEAESVRAFDRIARELVALGAPDELCQAARDAAADERVHATRCAHLLGEVAVFAPDDLPLRGPLAFALDNVREGCIGEAYAALVNVVQASAAIDPDLRAHFAAIAVDELAHAALAHAIATWIDTELSNADRRQVRAARDEAVRALSMVVDAPATDATHLLGQPSGAPAQALLETVARASAYL